MDVKWKYMGTLTLKDLPERVHRALRQRARENGRSLNREAVNILTAAVTPTKIDVERLLEELRRDRDSMSGKLTETLLREAKNFGRP